MKRANKFAFYLRSNLHLICKWGRMRRILELSTFQGTSENAKFCEERQVKARSLNR